MAFRKYIIRNGSEEAWLTNISVDSGVKIYRYMPDAGMAMIVETIHEARKIAKECRGRVQILRRDKSGRPYGEDVGK